MISAGAGNRFGHPHPDVTARLDAYAPIYSTADGGTVRFRTDGSRLWIDTTER